MTTRGDIDTYGNKYNHGELSQASANSYQVIIVDAFLCILY